MVDGDVTRLEQIVLNLPTNAITYAPGTERIEVRLTRVGNMAALSVRDYGPGIAPAELPQIFNRFFQPARASTHSRPPNQGGLGLGLFITRELVKAHGVVSPLRPLWGKARRLPCGSRCMHGHRAAGDGLNSLNGPERAAGWQACRLPGLHIGSESHEPDQRRDEQAVYAPGSWVTDAPVGAVSAASNIRVRCHCRGARFEPRPLGGVPEMRDTQPDRTRGYEHIAPTQPHSSPCADTAGRPRLSRVLSRNAPDSRFTLGYARGTSPTRPLMCPRTGVEQCDCVAGRHA